MSLRMRREEVQSGDCGGSAGADREQGCLVKVAKCQETAGLD